MVLVALVSEVFVESDPAERERHDS